MRTVLDGFPMKYHFEDGCLVEKEGSNLLGHVKGAVTGDEECEGVRGILRWKCVGYV